MLHTPDQTHQQTDSARLDYLIARLEDSADPQKDLVLEHLACARTFLLGAMPEEYAYNLRLAENAAGSLSDQRLERDLRKTISNLLLDVTPTHEEPHHSHQHHPQPTPHPSTLAQYFRDKKLSHGIFYPQKHVVAVFSSLEKAENARNSLLAEGFYEDEVLAVAGDEVLAFLTGLRQDTTLWGELMMEVSRLLDTEAPMVNRYEEWARKGSGFLVVYCDQESDVEHITRLIAPFAPVAAHWYMPSYIRHLTSSV